MTVKERNSSRKMKHNMRKYLGVAPRILADPACPNDTAYYVDFQGYQLIISPTAYAALMRNT